MTEEERQRRLQAYALQNYTGQLKVQNIPQAPKVQVTEAPQKYKVSVGPSVSILPKNQPLKVSTPYSVRNFFSNQPQAKPKNPLQGLLDYSIGKNTQGDNRGLFSKLYDQGNLFDAGRTFRQATPTTKDNLATQVIKTTTGPMAASTARTVRTGIGIGQGAAGLYDLATPGTGTSRVSKFLDKSAKTVDKAGRAANTGIYEALGPAQEIGLYVGTGGALAGAKAAATAGKAGIIAKIGKVLNTVDKPAAKLASKTGKVGNTVSGAIVTPELVPEVAGTVKYIGEDASKGKQITPERVLVDIATGVGGNLAGSYGNRWLQRLAKEKIFDRFAKESDPNKIAEQISKDIKEVPQSEVGAVSEQIAKSTDPEEIKNIIATSVDKTPTTPEAPKVPEATTGTTDDVAGAVAQVTDSTSIKTIVDGLFPNADQTTKTDLVSTLAKTKDPKEVKRILDAAQTRQAEITKTVETATPQPVPAQTIDQAVQESTTPVAPQRLPEAPQQAIPTETTTPSPAGVANATDATNVPGAINAGGTPPPTPPQTPSGMAPEPEPGAGTTKEFNNYIDDIAQSQGIDTAYQAPEMFAFNKLLSKATGGRVRNLMQINPLRKGAQKLEDTISNKAQQVNTGKGSKTLNTARTVWSQTGISDVNRQANRRFRDAQSLAGDLTKREMHIGDDLMAQLPNGETSIDNIYRVIADNNILKRTHGDNARLTLNDLSPEEQLVASRIIEAQKRTNEINYKIGKITKEQYEAEKELGHYARIFDIESNKGKSLGKKPIDTKPFIGQKDPSEFSDSLMEKFIKDPYRGALARQEIALRSLASHEFMQSLADSGNLLNYKPNKGFQQLTGKKYGKFEGMWADNTTRAQIKQNMEFESEWAKRYVGQLLDDYKATWAGKTQRALKATKTVLNPGTNIQNFMSNVLLFNRGSGVGILRNLGGITKAGKDLAQARNGNLTGELIKAKKLGVFGSDSGKAMVGDIGAEELASIPGKKGFAMKALGTAEDIYGGTDNAAKLALWRNLQRKGMSAEDAALQVQKFTQDYHNVGRVIGAMADAPVLGKPFARFIPELVRLTKNNLLYNPAGTIAGLAALAYTANALSQMANESDEDRKLREDQVGNTSLPGTAWLNKALGGPNRDISLNFAVGDSSVNIARAVGLNFPMEPGSDPNRALLEQLLPFEIPTRKDAQGNEVFDVNKIITQLGVRPLVEVMTDRNFIGQSIRDPENKTRVEGSELGKTYQGDISKGEKAKNIAGHLFRAYAPMGNEIDSMVAAIKGVPNAFGKERTPLQAALRVFGVKVEKNDMATREKRAETKEFFDGKLAQVNDFLNKNPDLKETYLRLKSGTVDRATGKKVVDLVKPEKWQLITSDKTGRLFDQLKTENEYLHKQNSNYPIDPIFRNDLGKEQRNQVLQIRSSYSGDNIEQEEILRATAPWYNKFEAAERDYNDKMSKYFKDIPESKAQNERVKAYGELYNKYAPQQTPLMQKYYQLKESNPQAAKDLFKTNPELSDQFDAYKQQKLKYINEKRKIEGVPPIDDSTFNNVTFGYEDDERKVYNELRYGKFGFGTGGGSSYGRFGYSKKGSTKEAATPSLDLSTLLAGVKPSSIQQSSVIDTTPKKLKFKVKVPSSSKGKRLRLQ